MHRLTLAPDTWRVIHYITGALWGAVMLWGIVGYALLGTKGLISSVPLIFVSSMWANMMLHFEKAQTHRIEDSES